MQFRRQNASGKEDETRGESMLQRDTEGRGWDSRGMHLSGAQSPSSSFAALQ